MIAKRTGFILACALAGLGLGVRAAAKFLKERGYEYIFFEDLVAEGAK